MQNKYSLCHVQLAGRFRARSASLILASRAAIRTATAVSLRKIETQARF